MGIGPAPAIRKGLEKVDWSLEDADLLKLMKLSLHNT